MAGILFSKKKKKKKDNIDAKLPASWNRPNVYTNADANANKSNIKNDDNKDDIKDEAKNDENKANNDDDDTKASEQKDEPKKDNKPVIRPFAVMRLTHEGIRAGINDVKNELNNVDDSCSNMDTLKGIFGDLERCINCHAKMEDDIFFPKLNKDFDNIIDTNEIPGTHTKDTELRTQIRAFFDENKTDKSELTKLINDWCDAHESHLKLEEQIMMPLTPKTGDTPKARGEVVQTIINADRDEFNDFLFEYVLKQLVKTKPYGPVMMFCKATQLSSNKSEYEAVKTKIKDIVGEETYKKLQNIGIDDDGIQEDIYE